MASQKQTPRPGPGQADGGGTATRADSGRSGRDGKRQRGRGQGAPAQGDSGPTSSRQDSSRQDSSRQGGSGQSGRGGQGGQAPPSRANNSRANNSRAQNGRGPGGGQGRSVGTQARPAAQLAGPTASAAAQRFSAPRWLQLTALVLSLAGLGMSLYLTIAHYTSTSSLACADKGYVNCAKVTTSPESMVFGVFPVAVLGLAFYVFMVAINSPRAWRSRSPVIWWARLGGIVTGIGFVLYLIYAEVIEIGNLCLLCTTVHVITFLLFALLVFAAAGNSATARNAV